MPHPVKLPDKRTMAYELLQLIAILGELPSHQLSRLPGGERYKERLLTDLKKQKLIRTYYRDEMRGHRLTAKAKVLLLDGNPSRFSSCLAKYADTNHVQSEPLRRERLWRIAEATVTMKNADISVFPDEHPRAFLRVWDGADEIETASFYPSREVTAYGNEFVRAKGARFIGVLLTDTRAYIAYNLGDSLMKWAYKSEMRTKAQVSDILCRERFPDQYTPDDVRGMIFANKMELAYEILSNSGNKQYFILDGSYENFYYVTNDQKGELLLRFLCDKELREELDERVIGHLDPPKNRLLFEHDALLEDGTPVLLAYDCDLRRISKFTSMLNLQERHGVLMCFDYQADTLGRFCGERVTLKTIDYEKVKRRFFENKQETD